ncbi:MAG TPA: zinc ribbon domain-containing protein [Vicinamibacterales bacterium]|nr:zinc ribbon domain-containing protein [Vicinamibacterales bacterium]
MTDHDVRLKPDSTNDDGSVRLQADGGLQAWQFFVLAGLVCATVATFMARGQSISAIVLVSVLMAATTIVGIAVLRTVRPLVFGDDDRTQMIGQRTRAALDREKMLVLRSIKELEFDKAMGKLSTGDFDEMSARLRARAARLIRQLDAGGGYRAQVEEELQRRIGQAGQAGPVEEAARFCAACGAARDVDAKFCKQCGTKL